MGEAKKKSDDHVNPGTDLTRREWLVSFAGVVVLSGLRGTPPAVEQALNAAGATLPPGLYQPALDHLTHALAGEGAFVAIPPGAETEYVQPRSGPFIPHAFAQEEFAVLRRLVEIVLGEDLQNTSPKPALSTSASISDEVAEWIDLVVASAPRVRAAAQNLPADQRSLAVAYFGSEEPVRKLETFEPERVCHQGLAWLAEESRRRFAKAFLNSDPASQLELVRSISDIRLNKSDEDNPDTSHSDNSDGSASNAEGAETRGANAGTRLFDFLKAECIRGFYTSRIGLTELNYKGNAFYAESPGCGLMPKRQP